MNEAISILIVDDDSDVQSVIEDTLNDGGYAPSVASTGEEAAMLLNANKYRAIIVDISFGRDRVRGWSVARRARVFDPTLPVIYITGGNADDWTVEGVPNSILLTKPFAPAQLLTAVSQLLNARPAVEAP